MEYTLSSSPLIYQQSITNLNLNEDMIIAVVIAI